MLSPHKARCARWPSLRTFTRHVHHHKRGRTTSSFIHPSLYNLSTFVYHAFSSSSVRFPSRDARIFLFLQFFFFLFFFSVREKDERNCSIESRSNWKLFRYFFFFSLARKGEFCLSPSRISFNWHLIWYSTLLVVIRVKTSVKWIINYHVLDLFRDTRRRRSSPKY